ncbi:unnamed protein product [Miscanthus lutarioriparius]|uniref:Uncharacterized protein n=1 Tax=Miscanthus lutarioriparius TaxID=422564 RepID=A0A811ND37_9POAL|nr:unnamed protein product [Miscanthus lutarioriparius]
MELLPPPPTLAPPPHPRRRSPNPPPSSPPPPLRTHRSRLPHAGPPSSTIESSASFAQARTERPKSPAIVGSVPVSTHPRLKSIVVGSVVLVDAEPQAGKRVHFASRPLHTNRIYSPNGAQPAKSCLKSASAALIAGILGTCLATERPGHSRRPLIVPSQEECKLDVHSSATTVAPREADGRRVDASATEVLVAQRRIQAICAFMPPNHQGHFIPLHHH